MGQIKKQNYCVYRHIREDKNEPFYIGIGRTLNRANQIKGRNNYWKNITKKTPWKSEILFTNLCAEKAKEKEKEFISLYGRKSDGGVLSNITLGGDGSQGVKPKNSLQFIHMVKYNNVAKTEEDKIRKRKWLLERIKKFGPLSLGRKHTLEERIKIQNNKKNCKSYDFSILRYPSKELVLNCKFLSEVKSLGLDPSNVHKKLKGLSGSRYKDYYIKLEKINNPPNLK